MVLSYAEMKALKSRKRIRKAHEPEKECPFCGYAWKSKVLNPVSCPRCKRRLDYVQKVPAPTD
jgi:rubrerythrin